jgi:hypothetical protein
MFEDIERMDAAAWSAYLAPDAIMRLGNRDPVYGRDACRDALAALYRRIAGMTHHIIEQWEHGETTIVEANITYTRLDATQVSVPAVTIFRTNGKDQIADYRVYIDPGPIYSGGNAQTV